MMGFSSSYPLSFAPPSSSFPIKTPSSPPNALSWGLQSKQLVNVFQLRSDSQAVRVSANPNMSGGKGTSKGEVIMVDPLEAKRLAAKQMQEIQAKEKLERQRRIEAINGAWAMIGLTAGLVIEGRTGNSILAQLAGYWAAITGFFPR